MIRSMTGFAAVTREDATARVHVTVKSVNHRFLDIVVKAPQALAELETRIKSAAQRRLARGRLDVLVAVEHLAAPAREVELDERLLEQVATAFAEAREKGLVTGTLTPGAGLPEALAALVETAVAEAIEAVARMRETEGAFLASDVNARLSTLSGFVDGLERLAREGQAGLEARLRERLEALPPDLAAEPAAVAQEVVRFVARSDIDEEVVRMRGHFEHWRALSGSGEPCGRKLDFLVQEMNREINTIGSKAEGPRVTEVVIAAKAELERIREQVQNVE